MDVIVCEEEEVEERKYKQETCQQGDQYAGNEEKRRRDVMSFIVKSQSKIESHAVCYGPLSLYV